MENNNRLVDASEGVVSFDRVLNSSDNGIVSKYNSESPQSTTFEANDQTFNDNNNHGETFNPAMVLKSNDSLHNSSKIVDTAKQNPETKGSLSYLIVKSGITHSKSRSSSFSKRDKVSTEALNESVGLVSRARSSTVNSISFNRVKTSMQNLVSSGNGSNAEINKNEGSLSNIRERARAGSVSKLKIAPEKLTHSLPASSPETPVINSMLLGKSLIKDLEIVGMPALICHPINRMYFLLHLLHRQLQPLFFFKIDVEEYRQTFYRTTVSQRHLQAYRIYQTYMTDSSPMEITKCDLIKTEHDKQLHQQIMAVINATLQSPSDSIFNDIELLVSSVIEREEKEFRHGAAYQALMSDYGSAMLFSKAHLERALQRLLEVPQSIVQDSLTRMLVFLDSYKYDLSQFPGYEKYFQGENEATGFLSMALRKTKKNPSSQSLSDLSRRGSSNDLASLSHNDPSASPKLRKLSKAQALSQAQAAVNNAVEQHPFVLAHGDLASKFCEYCFESATAKDLKDPVYQCEGCNYICHKSCRNSLTIPCTEISLSDSEKQDEDLLRPFESAEKLLLKYASLQKEISLSENIKSGIEKMAKAKDDINKQVLSLRFKDKKDRNASPASGGALLSQVAQADSKIQFLKTDLTKIQNRLAGLLCSTDVQNYIRNIAKNPECTAILDSFLKNLPQTVAIRVFMSSDLTTSPNRTRKSILVNQLTTGSDVIRTAMEKDPRKSIIALDSTESYDLCFEDSLGVDRVLGRKDLPLIVAHLIKDCTFFLSIRKTLNSPDSKSNASENSERFSKVDEQTRLQEKRRAVLQEIIDTDTKYTENMANAIIFYQTPLSKLATVTKTIASNIFGNMKELMTLHEHINRELTQRLKQDSQCLESFIDVYYSYSDQLSANYMRYCSNQHNAQRTLSKLKEDPAVNRVLDECQSLPQVAKLGLSDILIQPMHRITRMPLILKRLLSYTPADHPDHQWIQKTIAKYEDLALSVNETVKRKESEYRLRYFQQNLDWNNVVEAFPIAVEGRELIQEKPFTKVLKKNTIDVMVFVFSDMIMVTQCHKRKDGSEEFQLIKQPIALSNLAVINSPITGDDGKPRHRFMLINVDREITTLEAFSNTDKVQWIQLVESLAFKSMQLLTMKWYGKSVDLQSLRERISTVLSGSQKSVISSLLNLNNNQLNDNTAPIPPSRSSSKTQLSEISLNELTDSTMDMASKGLDQMKKTTTSIRDLFKTSGKGGKKGSDKSLN